MSKKFSRGNALSEFVLVFPLLSLLVFAFLDIGLLSMRRLRLEQEARIVARLLSLSKIEAASLEDSARRLLDAHGFKNCGARVDVATMATLPPSDALRAPKKAEIVTLTISEGHPAISPLLKIFSGDEPITVEAQALEARIL